jgi:hypothetical protein
MWEVSPSVSSYWGIRAYIRNIINIRRTGRSQACSPVARCLRDLHTSAAAPQGSDNVYEAGVIGEDG